MASLFGLLHPYHLHAVLIVPRPLFRLDAAVHESLRMESDHASPRMSATTHFKFIFASSLGEHGTDGAAARLVAAARLLHQSRMLQLLHDFGTAGSFGKTCMPVSCDVFGHLVFRDNRYEPILQDSTELFQAIAADDEAKFASILRQRPELRDTLLTILYWGGGDASTGEGSGGGKPSSSVTARHRTPLMLAADFCSLNVAAFLIGRGADVRIKSPEDGLTAAQVACGRFARLNWHPEPAPLSFFAGR